MNEEDIIFWMFWLIVFLINWIIELKLREKRLKLELKQERYLKNYLYKIMRLKRRIKINLN